jgi:predicted Ser/Thr protein kinase
VLNLGAQVTSPASAASAGGSPIPALEDLASLFPQLEILGLVGRGGMGVVYKARQPGLDRFVALKILPPEVGRDPTFAERFGREARALARLNHPNIVAIYDSGQAGGLYYLLMEFVDGVNLRQAILADQVSPEKALAIVPQICDALQYAHEEGVVHRDIKPENVLLDRKGRVKVADFGLAKLLGLGTGDVTLTGTSQAMGTFHYMAPEQYEKPQAVDHRADIYSLGVVFYELLTGKLPLGRFELPSEKVQVDVRLDHVVLKTLEREPERRYQYVSEVKSEVETIAHDPAPLERVRPNVAPVWRQPQTAPVRSEGSGTAKVLIAIGLGALLCVPLVCGGGMVLLYWLSAWAAHEGPTSALRLLMIAPAAAAVLLAVVGIVLLVLGLNSKTPAGDVPPEKLPPMSTELREKVERRVAAPAMGLLVVAAVIMGMIIVISLFADSFAPMWGFLFFMALQGVFVSLIVVGAYHLRALRGYGLAIAGALAAMLSFPYGFILGVPIGIWALVVLAQSDVRRAFIERRYQRGTTQRRGAAVGWIIAAAALAVLVGPLLLLGLIGARQAQTAKAQSPAVVFSQGAETATMEDPRSLPAIQWFEGIPSIGPRIKQSMTLSAEESREINEALQDARSEYQAELRRNLETSKNGLEHTLIRVKPFPREIDKLENRFWTRVDKTIGDDQRRAVLRDAIHVQQEIFPFGLAPYELEVWKVGAWHHYRMFPSGAEGQGPQLREMLRTLTDAVDSIPDTRATKGGD